MKIGDKEALFGRGIMKIAGVTACAVNIPSVKGEFPPSVNPARTSVIVKVTTDEGVTGAGEAFGFFSGALTVARAIEDILAPVLLGEDSMQTARLWEQMYRATYRFGRAGVTLCAISGVEMALWDIAGKVLNAPVYQLLGGRTHDRVRGYASLARYARTEHVSQACETALKKGFSAFKLHQIDIASIAATRKVVGDGPDIMIDANCAWDVPGAIEMVKRFEPFDLYWCEEPIWPFDDYDGLAAVRAAVKVPLAAGENEYTARGFSGLISKQAVGILQPSVSKLGGIRQEKEVFALAEAFNCKLVPHCWSSGPAMAATLHICFSEANCELVETSAETPEASILTRALCPERGFWSVPEGPGLGIELDEYVMDKYKIS